MEVQIEYYERQTVLTNLQISKAQENIPFLKIENVCTENVDPNITNFGGFSLVNANDVLQV